MGSRTSIALSMALLGASAGVTRAEMISYSFQGTIFSPSGGQTPLRGSIAYNTQGTLVSANGFQSVFSTTGSITLSGGSTTITTLSFGPPLLVMLAPDHMDLRYQSWGYSSAPPASPPWLFVQLGIDGTGPAPIFPDLSSLPSRLPPGVSGPLIIDGHFAERDVLEQGTLNNFASVSVASLPEPGSLALASGGLFSLAGFAGRRRRHGRRCSRPGDA